MSAAADHPDGGAALDPTVAIPLERALAPAVVRVNERRVARGFWPKLRKVAPHIPFAADLVAVYYCARDPETPTTAKALIMAALAYFVIPTDAIPDVLVGIGYTDDAAVLAAVIALVGRNLKPRHREAGKAFLERLARDALSPPCPICRSGRRPSPGSRPHARPPDRWSPPRAPSPSRPWRCSPTSAASPRPRSRRRRPCRPSARPLTPRGADRWRTAGVLFLAAAWLVLAHLFLKAGAGWLAFTADLRKAALLALALLAAGWAAARLWKRLRGRAARSRPGRRRGPPDAGDGPEPRLGLLAGDGGGGGRRARRGPAAGRPGRADARGARACAPPPWAGRYIGQAAMAYAFLK